MPVSNNTHPTYKWISIKPLHIKNADVLYFSSIITEFTDTWTPRWTANNVYGRMDPISFYGGTGRELTLGFRVISDEKSEAAQNMKKIQQLIQYQYPVYSQQAMPLISAPPYFELKFMNMVGGAAGKKLRGYVNGALQINPGFQAKEQTQYFSEAYDKIYFSDVNITLRFQVLHEASIGFIGTNFNQGDAYPYGSSGSPVIPPSIPESPRLNQGTRNNDSADTENESATVLTEANLEEARKAMADRHAARQAERNVNTDFVIGSGGMGYIPARMPGQAHNQRWNEDKPTIDSRGGVPEELTTPKTPRVTVVSPPTISSDAGARAEATRRLEERAAKAADDFKYKEQKAACEADPNCNAD